jgi:hypothetical protein
MPAASITLEDDGGAVATKLVFSGGFKATSQAHQAAQILIALMDQHMQRMGGAVIDPLVIEQRAENSQLTIPDAQASRIILEA